MTTSPAHAKKQAPRDSSAPILVVTGLSREAACLGGGAGVIPVCSGADVRLLHAALLDLAEVEFSAVVSFGLAGGLDPTLRPGDVAVGTTATSDGEHFGTHPAMRKVLLNGFSGAGVAAREGAVAGVDAAVLTVTRKTALRGLSGAVAVDMESHVAGAFARRRGLPFAIIRAIGDPAARALPPLTTRAIRPDGRVDVPGVLRDLAREPAQLGDLIRAGLDARAAFATLGRCGGLIGPLLRLVLAGL
jgi:hopanoid-associated phosphorylase